MPTACASRPGASIESDHLDLCVVDWTERGRFVRHARAGLHGNAAGPAGRDVSGGAARHGPRPRRGLGPSGRRAAGPATDDARVRAGGALADRAVRTGQHLPPQASPKAHVRLLAGLPWAVRSEGRRTCSGVPAASRWSGRRKDNHHVFWMIGRHRRRRSRSSPDCLAKSSRVRSRPRCQSAANSGTLRRRSPRAWALSPRHNPPGSDAGRPGADSTATAFTALHRLMCKVAIHLALPRNSLISNR
jgi:hypothetical protein